LFLTKNTRKYNLGLGTTALIKIMTNDSLKHTYYLLV
jgi:hypothetical protein